MAEDFELLAPRIVFSADLSKLKTVTANIERIVAKAQSKAVIKFDADIAQNLQDNLAAAKTTVGELNEKVKDLNSNIGRAFDGRRGTAFGKKVVDQVDKLIGKYDVLEESVVKLGTATNKTAESYSNIGKSQVESKAKLTADSMERAAKALKNAAIASGDVSRSLTNLPNRLASLVDSSRKTSQYFKNASISSRFLPGLLNSAASNASDLGVYLKTANGNLTGLKSLAGDTAQGLNAAQAATSNLTRNLGSVKPAVEGFKQITSSVQASSEYIGRFGLEVEAIAGKTLTVKSVVSSWASLIEGIPTKVASITDATTGLLSVQRQLSKELSSLGIYDKAAKGIQRTANSGFGESARKYAQALRQAQSLSGGKSAFNQLSQAIKSSRVLVELDREATKARNRRGKVSSDLLLKALREKDTVGGSLRLVKAIRFEENKRLAGLAKIAALREKASNAAQEAAIADQKRRKSLREAYRKQRSSGFGAAADAQKKLAELQVKGTVSAKAMAVSYQKITSLIQQASEASQKLRPGRGQDRLNEQVRLLDKELATLVRINQQKLRQAATEKAVAAAVLAAGGAIKGIGNAYEKRLNQLSSATNRLGLELGRFSKTGGKSIGVLLRMGSIAIKIARSFGVSSVAILKMNKLLLGLAAALAAATAAANAFKAAITFGISSVFSLAGGVLRLGSALARLSFRAVATGIRATLLPITNLVAGFRQLARFAPIISAIGTIQFGRNLLDTFKEFDDQITRVNTNLGNFGRGSFSAFDSIRQQVLDIANTTVFTATETARATDILVRAGLSANQAIGALGSTLNLAVTGNTSLENASDVVVSAINTFGLGVSDLENVTDAIRSASVQAQVEVADLASTVQNAGFVFKEANISFEELLALTTQLGRQGVRGERAGTALRRGATEIVAAMKTQLDDVNRLIKKGTGDSAATLDDFLDFGGSKFKNGGFLDLLETLEDAKISLADLQELLGARGQFFAGLFGAGGVAQIRRSLRIIQIDQELNLAKKQADSLRGSLGNLLKLLRSIGEDIKVNLIAPIEGDLKEGIKSITASLQRLGTYIKSTGFKQFARTLLESFKETFRLAAPIAKQIAKWIYLINVSTLAIVNGLVKKGLKVANDLMGSLNDKFKEFAGFKIEELDLGLLNAKLKALFDSIDPVIDALSEAIAGLGDAFAVLLQGLNDDFVKTMTALGKFLAAFMGATFSFAGTIAGKAFGNAFGKSWSDELSRISSDLKKGQNYLFNPITKVAVKGLDFLADKIRPDNDGEEAAAAERKFQDEVKEATKLLKLKTTALNEFVNKVTAAGNKATAVIKEQAKEIGQAGLPNDAEANVKKWLTAGEQAGKFFKDGFKKITERDDTLTGFDVLKQSLKATGKSFAESFGIPKDQIIKAEKALLKLQQRLADKKRDTERDKPEDDEITKANASLVGIADFFSTLQQGSEIPQQQLLEAKETNRRLQEQNDLMRDANRQREAVNQAAEAAIGLANDPDQARMV